MIELDHLLADLKAIELNELADDLPKIVAQVFDNYHHGELAGWLEMIDGLPDISPLKSYFADGFRLSPGTELSAETSGTIISQLQLLHPWRKGPFDIHGINIDTEWRSDWKWDRIKDYLSPLQGRTILDVGCGNGYHLFRMFGCGAKLALGIDPSQKFYAQFRALKHFTGALPVHHVPIGIEYMPAHKTFDTVFSMGVLYHRRSPIEHILQLKSLVRKGGELVLETLVIDGNETSVLLPSGRYAQMRNVWFIPSTAALERWLQRCDLEDIRLVDVNQTSLEEQRATDWMRFHSLENYLDPDDINKTIEGYQAPTRATFIARVTD